MVADSSAKRTKKAEGLPLLNVGNMYSYILKDL